MTRRPKPVVIDLEGTAPEQRADPASAPPVPESDVGLHAGGGLALRGAARLAGAPRSGAGRLAIAAGGGFLLLAVGLWIGDFLAQLLVRNSALGILALVLLGLALTGLAVVALRELAAIWRLRRVDALRSEAESALLAGDIVAARRVVSALAGHFAGLAGSGAALETLKRRQDEILDAPALVEEAERLLLSAPDAEALAVVEQAARQVAAVTALVPLAFADVVVALVANLRMIRRIAAIYGGRSGTIGGWRLTRAVLAHLAATGALAVGDDALGSVAGGGLLSRLSRRFGEGVVNGALTARVGLAAMDLCRPLPFRSMPAPRVSAVVGRALAGLFGRAG